VNLRVMAVRVPSVSGNHICGVCSAPATVAILLEGQRWSDMCRDHALAEMNAARALLGLTALPRRAALRVLPKKLSHTT